MPSGTEMDFGDSAPKQSPVLVDLPLADATAISFVVTGGANHIPSCPPQCDPPDGSSIPARHGSANGISNLAAPYDSLIGVFLDDNRPDRSRAPRGLDFGAMGTSFLYLSPELKQIFFIGAGNAKKGVARRFLVPKGATRLFLGTMDGFGWNNNSGSFLVIATLERSDVSSNMFLADSDVTYANWPCLPDRSRCTPAQEVIEARGPGRYHVLLPAQREWGASIPVPVGSTVTVSAATGVVCLDFPIQGPSSCSGPQGRGGRAGDGFLAPDEAVGALIGKTPGGRVYFSVNDRSGAAFQKHDGYFEFDVTVR